MSDTPLTKEELALLEAAGYAPAGGCIRDGEVFVAFTYKGERHEASRYTWRAIAAKHRPTSVYDLGAGGTAIAERRAATYQARARALVKQCKRLRNDARVMEDFWKGAARSSLARAQADANALRAELAQERAATEAERARREKAERALRLLVESAEQDGDASVSVPRVAYVLARRTLEGQQ